MKIGIRGFAAAGLALAVLVPGTALAQDSDTRVDVPTAVQPRFIIEWGGGVFDYAEGLDNVTEPGFGWDLRGVARVLGPIGIEAAYLWALNPLEESAGGAEDDRGIMVNGGEAMLRAEVETPIIRNVRMGPYVAAGVGIEDRRIVDSDNLEGIDDDNFGDSQDFTIPAAVGIQAYFGNFTVGARGTYRYIFDDELQADEDAADAQTWAATARIGAAF